MTTTAQPPTCKPICHAHHLHSALARALVFALLTPLTELSVGDWRWSSVTAFLPWTRWREARARQTLSAGPCLPAKRQPTKRLVAETQPTAACPAATSTRRSVPTSTRYRLAPSHHFRVIFLYQANGGREH